MRIEKHLIGQKVIVRYMEDTDSDILGLGLGKGEDGKGEDGSPRVDAVCRRHRVVRRQGCGHDRVPGVVEESLGRQGNAGQ